MVSKNIKEISRNGITVIYGFMIRYVLHSSCTVLTIFKLITNFFCPFSYLVSIKA